MENTQSDSISRHITIMDELSGMSSCTHLGHWLSEPISTWNGGTNPCNNTTVSSVCPSCPKNDEDIILVQQYYIDNNDQRFKENALTLQLNASNKAITRIVLLNERIYTESELGNPPMDKITQIVCEKRLTYYMAMKYVKELGLKGYIALTNSDIFFDSTIDRLRRAALSGEQRMFCQLRHEFTSSTKRLNSCITNCLRPDSQDAWLWHTSLELPQGLSKVLDISMGVAGCDNKIMYIMSLLGVECYNEPERIKVYHYHESQIRTYDSKNPVARPWYAMYPHIQDGYTARAIESFNPSSENNTLREFVAEKLAAGKTFIMPRIAGIENHVAFLGAMSTQGVLGDIPHTKMQHLCNVMKNNAGINISGIEGITLYSRLYLDAFHKCDGYFWWQPWGNVIAGIIDSYNFIVENFTGLRVDAKTLDVFHNIHREPWTLALRGKRLLIISPFEESMKAKIADREKIYGIDLFPECEFVFIKPPQTQGLCESREFQYELDDFIKCVDTIKNDFDVALCSCGGYGNLVCSALFDMGKSSIYVGGVLQMYFGIYGERWQRETPDVLELYKNEHWTRPMDIERPSGYESVEGKCYW